jgi:hypothetical protein
MSNFWLIFAIFTIFKLNDIYETHRHQTVNLDTPTVALTGTVITKDCYKDVQQQLEGMDIQLI